MRAVKSESELEYIKQAQRLTDKTFSYILSRINTERTEREIMLDMEFYMRKLGSDGVSFDFIVVSGKNSSLPHGVPTDKRIERGDFVTMDFGAVVNGYRSDMTRTVAVGYIIDEQRLVYNTVLNAKAAAVSADVYKRQVSVRLPVLYLQAFCILLRRSGGSEGLTAVRLWAVSYTHLDVYKRQV